MNSWWMLPVCIVLVFAGMFTISMTTLGIILLVQKIKEKLAEKRKTNEQEETRYSQIY